MTETTNIIIGLRMRGWSDEEINDFMLFIETNRPTQKQILESKKKRSGSNTAGNARTKATTKKK